MHDFSSVGKEKISWLLGSFVSILKNLFVSHVVFVGIQDLYSTRRILELSVTPGSLQNGHATVDKTRSFFRSPPNQGVSRWQQIRSSSTAPKTDVVQIEQTRSLYSSPLSRGTTRTKEVRTEYITPRTEPSHHYSTTIQSPRGFALRSPRSPTGPTSPGSPRSPATPSTGSRSYETVTVETTSSLRNRTPPSSPPYAIANEYTVTRSGNLVDPEGKVIGRRPRYGEHYGIKEDFIVNEDGVVITKSGKVLGRSPKSEEKFGIRKETIVTSKGEFVSKDGKLVGRPPREGDYTVNEMGQYVIGNSWVLEHSPDSGQYLVNEYGEIVTKDGRIVGRSVEGFGNEEVSYTDDVNVSGT